MQHLRGRIAKSDVRTTYVPRTYASSTVSRHFGAETKRAGNETTCSPIPIPSTPPVLIAYSMPPFLHTASDQKLEV